MIPAPHARHWQQAEQLKNTMERIADAAEKQEAAVAEDTDKMKAIEQNTAAAKDNMVSANKALENATNYQLSAKRQALMAMCGFILLLLIGAIVAYFFLRKSGGNHHPPPPPPAAPERSGAPGG